MTLSDLKDRVKIVLGKLPEGVDRAWLVANYLSLRTAQDLGYVDDSFARLTDPQRTEAMLAAVDRGAEEGCGLAGLVLFGAAHFFNNALFRMAAQAELVLQCLYCAPEELEPPGKRTPSFYKLVKRYKTKFSKSIDFIDRLRIEVNQHKHHQRNQDQKRPLETMTDGILAFEQLLSLLEQYVWSNNGMQPTRKKPRAADAERCT